MASKRRLEMTPRADQDPDYEMVTTPTAAKRQRVQEEDAKDQTVRRMQVIIKRQFNAAIQDKEKEIELVDERLQKARVQLDKLRACIVARYYGKAGLSTLHGDRSKQKLDLSHPAIQRALGHPSKEQPPRSSSAPPLSMPPQSQQGGADTDPSHSGLDGVCWPESGKSTPIAELLGQTDAFLEMDRSSPIPVGPHGPKSAGTETFGVGPALDNLKPPVTQVDSGEGSRFHVKKRIIVGNVSKYIPPGHREDSDPSTHKWMVYVRGPPDEPRIDHFVEKVWFFLHPSYRPNDLLEVKEPPFHLTRRGWGEFPIRVQLHFKDPRNKKVDIIHHLKLDRTYTGLQTLGAETIVDVELDRYLFSESGDPLSRPSTPTVTKVNYKEGLKPDLTRMPVASRSMPVMPSERQSTTTPSPMLLESIARTPEVTPDKSRPPSCSSTASSPLVKPLPTDGFAASSSSRATPISILSLDGAKENQPDMNSLVRFSSKMKSQSGLVKPTLEKPVRAMPPLGPISAPHAPISTSLNKNSALQLTSTQASMDSLGLAGSLNSTSLLQGASVSSPSNSLGQLLGSETQTISPPHSGAINVGDLAMSSPGSKLVRIKDGQIIQDPKAVSPSHSKAESMTVVTLNQSVLGTKSSAKVTHAAQPAVTTTPTMSLQKIPVPMSYAGQQHQHTIVSASSSGMQSTISISQLGKHPMVASPVVRKSPAGITLLQQPSAQPSTVPQQPVMSAVPTPPTGTQYYVTAKSTDKNLQGKVILIPQQVFSQSSNQGRGRGTGQQASKQGSSSFLSPSNVLILPQGSIVPPLPPGSIVQIQPVPTPSPQTPNPSQPITRIALTQKSGASTIISPKPATQRVASGGGVIQIQRSAGQTLAKLVPAASGINTQQTVTSAGVSLLPEMKGQLARTPAGGVVLVQRTPASKTNTIQTISGIQNVLANQQGMAQKLSVSQVAGGNLVSSQQKVSFPIKGGTSVLLPQHSKASSSQTIVLHPQASTKTIQVRTTQPTMKNVTKFVPPLNQSIKESETLNSNTEGPAGESAVKGSNSSDNSLVRTKSVDNKGDGAGKSSNHVAKPSKLDCEIDIVSDTSSPPLEENKTESTTSGLSVTLQDGNVQNVKSMQLNVADISSDVEMADDTVSAVPNAGARNSSGVKENQRDVGVNNGSVKIKQEIVEDIVMKDTIEVHKDLNQNTNTVNGDCVVMKDGDSVTQPNRTLPNSKTMTVNNKKSNGSIVDHLTLKGQSLAQTSNSNKCVIRVVSSAKLDKPGCQLASDPRLSDQRLRVVRIKKEPGCEPILATLATAPLLLPDHHRQLGIAMETGEEEDEGDGWESKELKAWMRVLGERVAEETNLYGVRSMEQLMKYVAEQAPMIDPERVQNELPFCATSLEQYQSWTHPKRRAMEWQRAVFMRQKVARLKEWIPCLRDVSVWSKKTTVVWCRQHGFTPPDPGFGRQKLPCEVCGQTGCSKNQRASCKDSWLSKSGVLKQATFTAPDDLSTRLQTAQASMRTRPDVDDDIIIDVITPGDPSKRLNIKTEGEEKQELKCFMPPSEGALYIRDAAQKIGVHFKPVQVGEDTYSPVIQEIIYAATRQFADDLLRGAFSKAYGVREDNRFPEDVLPLHIHQAVSSSPSCDFLTNTHLGVVAMAADDTKEEAK